MAWIEWVEEQDATWKIGEIYATWRKANPHRSRMADILKCFSPNPELLQAIIGFTYPLHFSEGHLTRRQKEMIATFVSGLNGCPY